jgi:myo-inositol-1(or 4)-monophosphatase
VDSAWAADLELALEAARAASDAIMRAFRTEHHVVFKSPDQPQTQADLDADRILHEILLRDRAAYGWLSEETVDRPGRLQRERVWIVDPIDGTRSYIAGRPEFAVSIALAERGAAVVGVVANPATNEVFWGVAGKGAFKAPGERIVASTRTVLQSAVLAASRSELRDGEFEELGVELELLPVGSTAYKLAKIASGEADIFLSRGPKSEWDICAGDLLVREAGGRMTDLRGQVASYNRPDPYVHGVLATNGPLHDEMLARLGRLTPTGRFGGEERLNIPGFCWCAPE